VIVVDASTLTDYLVGREAALVAVLDALGEDTEQPLHAPELVWPETLNALRGMAQRGNISDDRATRPPSNSPRFVSSAIRPRRSPRACGACAMN
jgi:predicted nucleic acid-binding protein